MTDSSQHDSLDFILGRLDAKEQCRFERAMREAPRLAAEVRATADALAEFALAESSATAWTHDDSQEMAEHILLVSPADGIRGRRRFWPVLWPIAAALVIGVLVGRLWPVHAPDAGYMRVMAANADPGTGVHWARQAGGLVGDASSVAPGEGDAAHSTSRQDSHESPVGRAAGTKSGQDAVLRNRLTALRRVAGGSERGRAGAVVENRSPVVAIQLLAPADSRVMQADDLLALLPCFGAKPVDVSLSLGGGGISMATVALLEDDEAVALGSGEREDPSALMLFDPNLGEGLVNLYSLPSVKRDETLRLWVRADGGDYVFAGDISPELYGGSGSVFLLFDDRTMRPDEVLVTREPKQSPPAEPGATVILRSR